MQDDVILSPLVASDDEEFEISLGEVLPSNTCSHTFYDILSEEDFKNAYESGMKIFIYDPNAHAPTRMIFDGSSWFEGYKPPMNEVSKVNIASLDGLLAVGELVQSEIEAVAVTLQTAISPKTMTVLNDLDTTSDLTRKDPWQALASKLLTGRMALAGKNIFDVSNSARMISGTNAADMPDVFYEEDAREESQR